MGVLTAFLVFDVMARMAAAEAKAVLALPTSARLCYWCLPQPRVAERQRKYVLHTLIDP
jgi:hypothetical protein